MVDVAQTIVLHVETVVPSTAGHLEQLNHRHPYQHTHTHTHVHTALLSIHGDTINVSTVNAEYRTKNVGVTKESGRIEQNHRAIRFAMGITRLPFQEERQCLPLLCGLPTANAVSKRDALSIPDIHDDVDNRRGSRYFVTIDLLSGY